MDKLISLALSLAPELAPFLFGEQADATMKAINEALRVATGAADLETARAVLSRDPAIAEALRLALAKIAADRDRDRRLDAMKMVETKVAALGSFAQAVPVKARQGFLGWGAPLVSALVLLTFAVVMGVAMTRSLPAGAETMVNLLLGTLAAMASSVVSYWVGSSAGSAAKTDLLFGDRAAPEKSSKP